MWIGWIFAGTFRIPQSKGNNRFTMERGCGVEGVVAGCLHRWDARVQLAGGNLVGGCGDVAELAGGKIAVGSSHGRPEGAADDGPMLVEIAGSRGGVERGAGLVIAEGVLVFIGEEDGVFISLVEDARGGIAGKQRGEAGKRGCDTCGDAHSSLGVLILQDAESVA